MVVRRQSLNLQYGDHQCADPSSESWIAGGDDIDDRENDSFAHAYVGGPLHTGSAAGVDRISYWISHWAEVGSWWDYDEVFGE